MNCNFQLGSGLSEKMYIAAQAPTKEMLDSYWQMVWETGSLVIITLCARHEENLGPGPPETGAVVYGDVSHSHHGPSEKVLIYPFYLTVPGAEQLFARDRPLHHISNPHSAPSFQEHEVAVAASVYGMGRSRHPI
jgi:Protein-tyrosine phosphatase